MISDKLKEIREDTKMNKKEFAEYIGMKYTTYNNYETGTREPASDFLIMISKKFKVSIDYIMGLSLIRENTKNYSLRESEVAHIEKYRDVDDKGKHTVDTVLDMEYNRCSNKEDTIRRMAAYNKGLRAAHNDYANEPGQQELMEQDFKDMEDNW